MTTLSPDFAQNSLPGENPAEPVYDAIAELLRIHAKTLIAAALEAEVASVVAELKVRSADIVRKGYLPERKVITAIGDVGVKVPRIRAKDGTSVNFTPTLIPKYLRRSRSISAWAAYAYLKGVSERDMAGVLVSLLRSLRRNNRLQVFLHWSEDLVGALGPDEGLRVLVPGLGPLGNPFIEFGHTVVNAALELLGGQGWEPALDLIHPIRIRWCEMELKPQMVKEPGSHRLGLMG
jgi:hypothetical protein